MLSQLLRRVGLVRASRYQAMEDRAHKFEQRVNALRKDQDTVREEAHGWKNKAADLTKALRDSENALRLRTSEVGKLRIQLERAQARSSEDTERARHRRETQDGEHSAKLAALKERLTVAQREVVVAREHLMAVEVKLDILEGAANVLDLRTREVVVRRDTQAETTL